MAATAQTAERHPSALPVGYELNGYEIGEQLGAGGFAITYAAKSELMQTKQVAIKEYLPSEFAHRDEQSTVIPNSAGEVEVYRWGLERFVDEANILHRLSHPGDRKAHPNIVSVEHIFKANSTAYIVMDWIRGKTLAKVIEGNDRFSQERLTQIVSTLLGALEYVHDYDAIHRDISPTNIIMRGDDDPVLIDFGAARSDIRLRMPHTQLFKPGYSPIEQEAGSDQDHRSDIYSLAATIYHAAFGIKPARATQRANALRENKPDPVAPAVQLGRGQYGEAFLKAIDWGLEISRQDRPGSVKIWRDAFNKAPVPSMLERAQTKSKVIAEDADAALKRAVRATPRWAYGAVAGVAVLVAFVALIVALAPGYEERMADGRLALSGSAEDPARLETAVTRFTDALDSQPEDLAATAGLRAVSTLEAYQTATETGRLDDAQRLLKQADEAFQKAGVTGAASETWSYLLRDAEHVVAARAATRVRALREARAHLDALEGRVPARAEHVRGAVVALEGLQAALDGDDFERARATVQQAETQLKNLGFAGSNEIVGASADIDVAVARWRTTGLLRERAALEGAPLGIRTLADAKVFLGALEDLLPGDTQAEAGGRLITLLESLAQGAQEGVIELPVAPGEVRARAAAFGLSDEFANTVLVTYREQLAANDQTLQQAQDRIAGVLSLLRIADPSSATLTGARDGLAELVEQRDLLPEDVVAIAETALPAVEVLVLAHGATVVGRTNDTSAHLAEARRLGTAMDERAAGPVRQTVTALERQSTRARLEINRDIGRGGDLLKKDPIEADDVAQGRRVFEALLEKYPEEPRVPKLIESADALRDAIDATERCAMDEAAAARDRARRVWPLSTSTEFIDIAWRSLRQRC